MAQPYIGEIRMFAGNFAPAGWWFCDGSQMPISENEALFQLIGTTYGGDGESTFNLPDLRSRLPLHFNGTFPIGEMGGVEEVTLTVAQMPAHNHDLMAVQVPGNQNSPAGNLPAESPGGIQLYIEDAASVNMGPAIVPFGGSQPHTNLQPYLAISFIISLYGIFPSPT